MIEGEEEERMVTSEERARLPRILPPRRKSTRRIMGRKKSDECDNSREDKDLNVHVPKKGPHGQ